MELIAQNSLVPIITNLRYVKRYWYFLYSVHNLRCWFESTSLGLSSLFFTSQTFQSYFLLSWNFHKGTFSYRGGLSGCQEDPPNHKFWASPVPRRSGQPWCVQVGSASQQEDFRRRVQHGSGRGESRQKVGVWFVECPQWIFSASTISSKPDFWT